MHFLHSYSFSVFHFPCSDLVKDQHGVSVGTLELKLELELELELEKEGK